MKIGHFWGSLLNTKIVIDLLIPWNKMKVTIPYYYNIVLNVIKTSFYVELMKDSKLRVFTILDRVEIETYILYFYFYNFLKTF